MMNLAKAALHGKRSTFQEWDYGRAAWGMTISDCSDDVRDVLTRGVVNQSSFSGHVGPRAAAATNLKKDLRIPSRKIRQQLA